jgi:hypothetical protein
MTRKQQDTTPITSLTIQATLPDTGVWALVRQNPMGDLKDSVAVTINGCRYVCECTGYASSGGLATLTLTKKGMP